MKGRITYTTTYASTPDTPFMTAGNVLASANIFNSTLAAGSTKDIYLHWGYKSLDPYYIDKRNVSQSASGVVQVSNFLNTLGYKFSIDFIQRDRLLGIDEYQVIEQLNYELVDGTPITWWPDFDNFPTEYYSCIAVKRLNQKRLFNQELWQFDFDLMVLNNVQIPSTVPDFVY